ncbi:hypothetical protein [Streptococcus equi]|uniref:hypothetical protein n=1 Tax=Streptococcus equi TaxID=1336 RepID=UPI0039C760B7
MLYDKVSPFMGEWIEIQKQIAEQMKISVSPFMGEWIEIDNRQQEVSEICLAFHGRVD